MTESDILFQLFSYNWPSFEELVEYANKRHGYVGDDGYYGVTYPSDLDEYQKEIEGEFIPEGFVEVMYWDGAHRELKVRETDYISALKGYLMSQGRVRLASELNNA